MHKWRHVKNSKLILSVRLTDKDRVAVSFQGVSSISNWCSNRSRYLPSPKNCSVSRCTLRGSSLISPVNCRYNHRLQAWTQRTIQFQLRISFREQGAICFPHDLKLSPLVYFTHFLTQNLCSSIGGGEPGRLWSWADIDDALVCPCTQVLIESERSPDQRVLGFLECSGDGSIDGQEYCPISWRLVLLR